MRKLMLSLAFLLTISPLLPRAIADEVPAQKYEYAVVKWDGPDRLYFNLPDKFELKHLSKEGVTIPKEAQNEEFCLAWAANKMAKDGWYAHNFDSRRILFRRVKP